MQKETLDINGTPITIQVYDRSVPAEAALIDESSDCLSPRARFRFYATFLTDGRRCSWQTGYTESGDYAQVVAYLPKVVDYARDRSCVTICRIPYPSSLERE